MKKMHISSFLNRVLNYSWSLRNCKFTGKPAKFWKSYASGTSYTLSLGLTGASVVVYGSIIFTHYKIYIDVTLGLKTKI